MSKPLKYAVFGAGSWATAIVKMLCENLDTVGWYMRSVYTKEHLLKEQHNPSYLSSVEFKPSQLKLSNDINEMAKWADVLVFVIPSAFIHSELEKLTVDISKKTIVSAVKGIMPETGKLVGEHFNDDYKIPLEHIAVIAGPCHAEEVALERLSYLTIACTDQELGQTIANALSSDYINTRVSDDVIGIEYAVMLKNIYAIAAGIAHGLGYGDNFQSVLMSNAIREMKRFINKMHKMKRNINDSAYLGDLLVTGYSAFSRNRMFGNMVGKGYTVKSAQMEMNMVAEGYYATKSAKQLNIKNTKKTKLPIIDAVYAILYENKNPKKVFQKLTEKLN
ncbi:NAD(P)H-dependent glycerol-3-phosphate dehydrogenase [Subsaximicrobium wynnwilliamsii]|uniref:Glycerol-3-phosphate dehydrogenase n=1 Tax=Subsaximicrobium wynnwilliamsii TaxID=291179 RepID=A0A5C6ZI65_9FLAO|nr:NAD(P)H-dependent glycerol-3-phosphate dehydrogenase [Subsaximicrobium wynnwilliamsii]TXD83717.1 NAD(P)H-dependent glycerol-3-phosphate dehydrogenase [Subsaximicrobium wynnwilliamsii]TXD89399.1 NAD(P)H-dependent glycerol-3-phosphate dehydrogenase [Subsaximicrobium wynnwilliamsii]TXE03554.1 NAD(P)H-dependent glycerol-3-phosphate dehydrogenase [Subsaximicrobium wynnwilliamsii]